MRLVVREMLSDSKAADAMKPYLVPSPEDWAEKLREWQQEGSDQDAAASILAKAHWMTQATPEEQLDALSRRQEVEKILRALELSHLSTAFALSVASHDRPSEAAAAVARRSVDVADALERIRETTSRLLKGAETTSTLAQTVEAKSIADLREAADALSQRTEELRDLVQQMLKDRRSGESGADFLSEPLRPLYARLADMLVLTPRLGPAEFDPSVSATFETAGSVMADALLGSWASDESQERTPSLSG